MTLLNTSTCTSRLSAVYDSKQAHCFLLHVSYVVQGQKIFLNMANIDSSWHFFYDLNLLIFYQNWAYESYGVLQSYLKATNGPVGCYQPSFSFSASASWQWNHHSVEGKAWEFLTIISHPNCSRDLHLDLEGIRCLLTGKKACFACTAIKEPAKDSSLCTRKGGFLHYCESLQNWILLVVWSWSWIQLKYFQLRNLNDKIWVRLMLFHSFNAYKESLFSPEKTITNNSAKVENYPIFLQIGADRTQLSVGLNHI
jgi:hypothetical protein